MLTLEEALNHTGDRVKLPGWIQLPKGSVPILTEVKGKHWPGRGSWGEGYVVWTIPPPDWEWAALGPIRGSQWFDLKDLELIPE